MKKTGIKFEIKISNLDDLKEKTKRLAELFDEASEVIASLEQWEPDTDLKS